ncbi:MAG: FIST N-terminal domain-containing protein [Armatimonadota bacterium]
MKFASARSEAETFPELVRELVEGSELGLNARPDLAVLFFTSPLIPAAAQLAAAVRERLEPRHLLGVSCESVVGNEREIERRAGAVLFTASLPGVDVKPFHLAREEWTDLLTDEEALRSRISTGASHRGQLLLPDPFTTPADELLPRLDSALGAPTFGGMASGSTQPGGNALLLDGEQLTDGAIGAGFGGALEIRTVVSQGCRPIGEPFVATRTEGQAIFELGRRPALEVAREVLDNLSSEEKRLAARGLMLGIAMNEYRDQFERGDFLVRGLLGAIPDDGALVVGDVVRPGQTVQLHVRDHETAHEDLVELLRPVGGLPGAAGALLFTCNGRGTRMFPQPDHDARTTLEALPGVPLAGFFAMGELGPVGGKSFIHGHTASLAIFSPGSSTE